MCFVRLLLWPVASITDRNHMKDMLLPFEPLYDLSVSPSETFSFVLEISGATLDANALLKQTAAHAV